MQTIIQTLFNNLTFLTTFLFFSNLFLKFFGQRMGRKSNWLLPILFGLLAGGVGITMMMFFSIRFHSGSNTIIVDFRQLAIMISFYYGGGWSGLISAVMIGIYRLFAGETIQFSSWIGLCNIMFTYVLTAICMKRARKVSLKIWMRTLIGTVCIYLIAVTIVNAFSHAYVLHAFYGVFYMLAGLFAYYVIKYMQSADETLVKMREAANHDFLTKLYNPRSFDRLFRSTAEEAEENGSSFALLVLDIDHFKRVNDQYGHLNGDVVLVQIAQLLSETIRKTDFCARKGGEEFAAILTPCTIEEALDIAERVRKRIEEHLFVLEEGQEIALTVSIGVSAYPQLSAERLFYEADQALYQAKETGRNRICVAESNTSQVDIPAHV
ncbi:diguanylate cyclase [Paenibacillus kandeliae]|uniref:diguanylate cyclase n=1 Tax=Paenibacillus kandeliae TaxID=3231269 RepID=UPI003458266F